MYHTWIIACPFAGHFNSSTFLQGFLYFIVFLTLFFILNQFIDFIQKRKNKNY